MKLSDIPPDAKGIPYRQWYLQHGVKLPTPEERAAYLAELRRQEEEAERRRQERRKRR